MARVRDQSYPIGRANQEGEQKRNRKAVQARSNDRVWKKTALERLFYEIATRNEELLWAKMRRIIEEMQRSADRERETATAFPFGNFKGL